MRNTSKTEWLASLAWQIRDAEEALTCAVLMRDWKGVAKYAGQVEALERKRFVTDQPGRWNRMDLRPGIDAGRVFGRGRLP